MAEFPIISNHLDRPFKICSPTKFFTQRIGAKSSAHLKKNHSPVIFDSNLKSLHKMHLSQKRCEIEILAKVLSQSVSGKSSAVLLRNSSPAIFGGHLEFLLKSQKHFSERLRDGTIWPKFCPGGYLRNHLPDIQKIIFLPFLASICINHINAFILETV